MKPSGQLRGILMASAVAALAFGAVPALAVTVNTPFGTCLGDATHDCVTATGHTSASMVTTLTINEEQAISFGNIAIAKIGGIGVADPTILKLSADGVRTVSGGSSITLLHGAAAGGAAGSGAQLPGHYTVESASEGGAVQVYIGFADTNGNVIDMCTPAGVCDNYHPGNQITLTGPGGGENLFMDKFVINESGNDVYGHFIDNTGGAANPSPGISNPFNHAHVPSANIDVVAGATLHIDPAHAAGAYSAGKYTGTFDIMASY